METLKEAFFPPGILKVLPKEAACSLPSNSTQERNLGKMFQPSAAVVCVFLPEVGCVPACLNHQTLLLSPWSLLGVTNHRRTAFQTRVGLPATSSPEASSPVFPFEHKSSVLQDATSEKCSPRTLSINLFAQPRAHSNETELLHQLVWGEPKSFLGMRSILLNLCEKLQRHETAGTSRAGCGGSGNKLMVTRGEGRGKTRSLGFTNTHYCI